MAQTRSYEQRFSLAISLQNFKENNFFIVPVVSVFFIQAIL